MHWNIIFIKSNPTESHSSTQASADSQTNLNPSEQPQDGAAAEKDHLAMFYTTVEPRAHRDAYERITFTETATFSLLDIQQSCLNDEDERVEEVKANNKKYLELCRTKVQLFRIVSN